MPLRGHRARLQPLIIIRAQQAKPLPRCSRLLVGFCTTLTKPWEGFCPIPCPIPSLGTSAGTVGVAKPRSRRTAAPRGSPYPPHPGTEPPPHPVELGPGHRGAAVILQVGAGAVEELLRQEHQILLRQPAAALHLRLELHVERLAELRPLHLVGHREGDTALGGGTGHGTGSARSTAPLPSPSPTRRALLPLAAPRGGDTEPLRSPPMGGGTHRLRKGVVPEHGGRGVVVLAAVHDHHHGQGQRLPGGRTAARG